MRFSKMLLTIGVLFLMACSGDGGPVTSDPDPDPGGGNGNEPGEAVASATVVAGSSSSTFTPPALDLLEDGTVTWSFGSLGHNVTFGAGDGAPADIPETTNEQVARSFGATGEFAYSCTIHPGMSGIVRVH